MGTAGAPGTECPLSFPFHTEPRGRQRSVSFSDKPRQSGPALLLWAGLCSCVRPWASPAVGPSSQGCGSWFAPWSELTSLWSEDHHYHGVLGSSGLPILLKVQLRWSPPQVSPPLSLAWAPAASVSTPLLFHPVFHSEAREGSRQTSPGTQTNNKLQTASHAAEPCCCIPPLSRGTWPQRLSHKYEDANLDLQHPQEGSTAICSCNPSTWGGYEDRHF